MRRKFLFVMLSVVVAIGASNCTTDSAEAKQEPTLQQIVSSAKILPGTLDKSQQEMASFYIDIPGRGYLVIKNSSVPGHDVTEEVMDLVYLRFKKEFDAGKAQNLEGKNLGSKVKNVYCGDWTPIGPDPNDRVYRYCCNTNTGVCVRKTCDCGYCCD